MTSTTARERGFTFHGVALTAGLAILLAATGWQSPARAAEPITIGLSIAQSGQLAANGKAALVGMKIWEDDINAKGGLLGRPVKLITYDDQSNPANVPALYTKLLDIRSSSTSIRSTSSSAAMPRT